MSQLFLYVYNKKVIEEVGYITKMLYLCSAFKIKVVLTLIQNELERNETIGSLKRVQV